MPIFIRYFASITNFLDQLSQKLCRNSCRSGKISRLFSQPMRLNVRLCRCTNVLTAYLPAMTIEVVVPHLYGGWAYIARDVEMEGFSVTESAQEHLLIRFFGQLRPHFALYCGVVPDIAKGRVVIAERCCGYCRLCTITWFWVVKWYLAWLVKSHLPMSITAQRRDIHDPGSRHEFCGSHENQVRWIIWPVWRWRICATSSNLWR